MKLLALLIGLGIERIATQLFHLRELRGLDHVIDAGFRQVSRFNRLPTIVPVVLLVVLLVLPVVIARYAIGDVLYGFAYLVLAVVVLFFSLGPKDIGEDIDEYCNALESEDDERIAVTARALTESKLADSVEQRTDQVEAAVCVQANNRLFAVIFWFVVLGPIGAWLYRITDLVRRRAVFRQARSSEDLTETGVLDDDSIIDAAVNLHGWLAWIPARLTAIGYGLAGNLDGATAAWRSPAENKALPHSEQSELLLARVGIGALAINQDAGETATERAIRGAMAANSLVFRLLFIWAAVIAAMTLYGWSV